MKLVGIDSRGINLTLFGQPFDLETALERNVDLRGARVIAWHRCFHSILRENGKQHTNISAAQAMVVI